MHTHTARAAARTTRTSSGNVRRVTASVSSAPPTNVARFNSYSRAFHRRARRRPYFRRDRAASVRTRAASRSESLASSSRRGAASDFKLSPSPAATKSSTAHARARAARWCATKSGRAMRFASRADADEDEDEAYDALERCAVDDAHDARATTTTTTRATRARRATREARVERND